MTGSIITTAGSATDPAIQPTGDTNTGIFFPAADTVAIAEGGIEVARVDSSGRFGLGTSAPTSRLHLYEASSAPALQVERGNTSLTTNDELGRIDFISNDNSTNANGARVRILSDVTNATGASRLRLQTKPSASTTFSTGFSVSSTDITVGNATLHPNISLNNQLIATGSTQMTNADTQIDIDITSLLYSSANYTQYFQFDVAGLYDSGSSTYARLWKSWAQGFTWTGAAFQIDGAVLSHTAYNSDVTNFPAGAVNAAKVLTIISGSSVLLRLQNRTSPAAGSTTYYQYVIRGLFA